MSSMKQSNASTPRAVKPNDELLNLRKESIRARRQTAVGKLLMGKSARLKPKRLAEKLVQIRNALGLSQSEMHRRLGLEELTDPKRISDYELGNSEPPLPVTLQYARAAGVHMEALVEDELDLPHELPGTTRHEAIKRQYASRRKAR